MFMLRQTSVQMAVLLHKQPNDWFHPLLTVQSALLPQAAFTGSSPGLGVSYVRYRIYIQLSPKQTAPLPVYEAKLPF